jgi:hypothetical protein
MAAVRHQLLGDMHPPDRCGPQVQLPFIGLFLLFDGDDGFLLITTDSPNKNPA